ncbi:WD domain, G-beta repeat [Seminavis robusta]|uniref:WD domain, G-beta repeat n=1 Tax=Seminavis robusta TaxID=568900 RepID=A0A9N8E0G2_9STRA|nr:WD domain, G-beta repeat [Seminavis robusta]|eukprot:Sro496_g154610.1 WD domain, G-beta repeat (1519) ;mRNA; f:31386-36264
MPVHLFAPALGAAAAWGALQDCESDTRDSPKEERPKPRPNETLSNTQIAAFEDAIEIQRRRSMMSFSNGGSPTSPSSRFFQQAALGDDLSVSENDNNNNDGENPNASYLDPPSVKHSTSTYNENPAVPVGSFTGNNNNNANNTSNNNNNNVDGPPSIRMINSFPITVDQKLEKRKSVQLRRGSSLYSAGGAGGPLDCVLSGFVDGDFAAGKVRDIPVDGCFVMAFSPQTHSLLAVGARKTLDFYETIGYSLACRFPRDAQVSAVQWLAAADDHHTNSSKAKATTRSGHHNLLAVGDLGGTVSLLQVQEEVLEMYGPTVKHTFQVAHQIRAIELRLVGHDRILLVVGDKGGNVTFSEYSRELEPLTNHVAVSMPNDKVLSLALRTNPHPPQQQEQDSGNAATTTMTSYLGVSFMGGEARVYELDTSDGNLKLKPQPVFAHTRRGAVRSVTFSPDGDLFVLGGYDKTAVLVDTQLWRVVRELKLEGTINVLEFDPATRYLAVGTRDKSFVVFDTSTFVAIKKFASPGWVTDISWGPRNSYKDCVAVRCERTCVSLLDLTPISRTTFELEDELDGSKECAISWSQTGRYCARIHGCSVRVSDSYNSFQDVAKFEGDGTLRGVAFCPAEGKENILAVVGLDGHMTVLKLCPFGSGLVFQVVKALFVEEHLWVVRWTPDGAVLATGGRGKVLHLFNAQTFERILSQKIDGRIWGIDFCRTVRTDATTSPRTIAGVTSPVSIATGSYGWQMAVASGADVAIIFDTSLQPWLQVHRPRTARALRYHPNLPILAIGDGSGCLAIVDYEQEETLKDFLVGSRVNTLDFSPKGDFLVVGTDDCVFTLYETFTYKPVQAIPVQGFAMISSFSPNGQCLGLGTAEGIYSITRLGPLLGVDLAPLELGVDPEVLYRSGDGPSFIQRLMRKGDQDSLHLVAKILHQHPEAIYAFDRQAKESCFDTALILRKPNLLKLAVMILVDGNLKLDSDAIMTSPIPLKARMALDTILQEYSPEFVVDIMRAMTFLKVPFSSPMVMKEGDCRERGSDSFMDPWPRKYKLTNEKAEGVISRGTVMRIPAVLPLPGLGTMQFLSSLIEKAPPTVFDNDAIAIVLRVLWKNHIQKYFILDLITYTTFFVLWIVLVDKKSGTTEEENEGTAMGTMAVAISVLILNTLFAVKELVQSDYGRRPGYIRSVWNIVDLLAISCVWYYVVVGCFIDELSPGLEPLAVVTSLLLTVRLVAYLRGISDTGWLVSVLTHNLHDVRGFLLILFVLLVGFTTTFRILFQDVKGPCEIEYDQETSTLAESCEAAPFDSYARSFVSSFQMVILGEYEPSLLYESEYAVLAIIIFIVAVTCVLIVALNALISVLADSYARVQANAAANRRKERAELIVEYMSILPPSKRQSIEKRTTYFHALFESDADGDLLLAKDDWQGGLNALRREMEELINATSERNQKQLEQFKTEIDSEINGLRRELVSLLEDMAGDVRSIRRLQSHDGITLNGKNVAKAVKAVKSIGRHGKKAIFGEQKP